MWHKHNVATGIDSSQCATHPHQWHHAVFVRPTSLFNIIKVPLFWSASQCDVSLRYSKAQLQTVIGLCVYVGLCLCCCWVPSRSRPLQHCDLCVTLNDVLVDCWMITVIQLERPSFWSYYRKTRDVFEDSMVEAKAKAKATNCCPRGVLEVEASLRGPRSLGFLPRDATQRAVMPRRLSVHHSQIIQRPTAASCACVWSIVFMVLTIKSFTY